MAGMTSFELIVSLALLLLVITAMMAVMFYMLNKKRDTKYNIEKNKVELDLMRSSLESQIYNTIEKFSKNNNRWKNLNHLQLDGNNYQPNISEKVVLNNFLKQAGLSEKNLAQERFVFVLTPFHDKFDNVFETIKKVCSQAGIKCLRGDEENFKSDIFPHILKNIVKSRIVIANLSGRNPNVMYELGIAHALDKPTIMVSQLLDKLPVDIKSKRIVTYKTPEDLENKLQSELLKVMK